MKKDVLLKIQVSRKEAAKRRFSTNHRLAEREDGNGVGDWPRTCSARIEIWWPEEDLVESRFVEKGKPAQARSFLGLLPT